MSDFFTWSTLAGGGSLLFATTAVTQLFKNTKLFSWLPTRIFSYFVAVLLLICGMCATDAFSWSGFGLCFLNAVLVSLAANGAYDGIATGNNA